jgi:hypothetical protein
MNGQEMENLLPRRAAEDFARVRRTAAFQAAVQGDWDNPEAIEAAIFFCQSLGYCRIWGVDLGPRDGSVPAATLPHVCAALSPRIVGATHRLENYERDMVAALTDEEQQLYSTAVLRVRMDAWAAWTAIDERVRMLDRQRVAQDEGNQAFGLILSRLVDAIEQWDTELLARADLLVAACDTKLIDNWRTALAEPFRAALPWWLDEDCWQQAGHQAVPDYLAELVPPAVADAPAGRDADALSVVLPAVNTGIQIDQPMTLAAAASDAEVWEAELSSQRNGDGARAIVQIHRQYTADQRLTVEVRFNFVARNPQAIGPGSIVRLGPEISAPALMTFPNAQTAILLARFSLSAGQVRELQLERSLRLTVDGRVWYPRAEPEESKADQ